MTPVDGADQLTTVISHATAPAFLLGAVAGFLSILISRAERVTDLEREAQEAPEGTSGANLATLAKRMQLLHGAIYFAVLSALATASLLIMAFISAFLGLAHQLGMAILFTVALILLMGSLVQLTRDVRIAMLLISRRQAPGSPMGTKP